MSQADGYVLPKPGIPKTLGILNIIFGVLLTLYGLCTVGSLVAAPAMMQVAEKATKDIQAKADARQKDQLKQFDDRIAAAKDDEEKKAIEGEKAAAIANAPPAAPQFDMGAIAGTMQNPTIMSFAYTQGLAGIVMNILMIVSGIGLIRIRSWGRSMALGLAALQIALALILTAVNIVVVQPVNQTASEKMFAQMEATAKAQGAGANAGASMQMARAMSGMATGLAIGMMVVSCIYPTVTLILLNTAGARAACRPKATDDFDQFRS